MVRQIGIVVIGFNKLIVKLEFVEVSVRLEQRVIPNQCADWCGYLHRIPGY